MLKSTEDPRMVFCDRCERHIVIDRTHPLFQCHDGKHHCLGHEGREPLQVFVLADAIPFDGGHSA
jgi:hypothetical protein